MRAKIFILAIFMQAFLSCKEEGYCVEEIKRLTKITLPEKIEVIECEDNLEYQFVFEYQLNDLSYVDSFIENNNLIQYESVENDNLVKEIDVVDYVGEFFEPNKIYKKSNTTYYIQRDNYSLVFDKEKAKFMGVVEY